MKIVINGKEVDVNVKKSKALEDMFEPSVHEKREYIQQNVTLMSHANINKLYAFLKKKSR